MVVHLPGPVRRDGQPAQEEGLTDIESHLLISERAHIVFDLHQEVDGAQEAGRGSTAIGTTPQSPSLNTPSLSRLIFQFNVSSRFQFGADPLS